MAKVRVQKLAFVSELASKLADTHLKDTEPPKNLLGFFLESFKTTPVGSDREISLDLSDQKSRESDVNNKWLRYP